jgi:hypothetical protein
MLHQALTHITTARERWDLLAWIYYGDATLYQYIIMSNPSVPIVPEFDPGTSIAIPILQVAQPGNAPTPPWRRPEKESATGDKASERLT